jgi:hypothetical protein
MIEEMSLNSKSLPTVDEIISSLRRSFIPTILIEGSDDAFIYRKLKLDLHDTPVSLQPCGGRSNLFSIYDRRHAFSDKNVVFVADRDAYRFIGIPENRKEIIFTTGYCIENDIYEGSNIHKFLDEEDITPHSLLRTVIGKWVAFEVDRFIKNSPSHNSLSISAHINVVSPPSLNSICPLFSKSINYEEPPQEIADRVINEYSLNIRGKQLFQMLSRFLAKKGRFSSFSEKNLIEIALKQGSNHVLDKLALEIGSALRRKSS